MAKQDLTLIVTVFFIIPSYLETRERSNVGCNMSLVNNKLLIFGCITIYTGGNKLIGLFL